MKILYSENLNQGRFETWIEKPLTPFHFVTQVHGSEIVSLETLPAEADGIIVSWDDFNHPLAITTADCLPIVIEGLRGVVFLHAGWRGLARGLLEKPEISLIGPQRVLIGPSIHECCFEVTEDFSENFPDSNLIKRDDKLFFNLQEEAKKRLRGMFPSILVEISPICTSCIKSFHSFRRDQTKNRNWNLYIKG